MYFYRCTEQQLGDALDRIHESGDTLLQAVYKGGRDWVLICRKAVTESDTLAYTRRRSLRAEQSEVVRVGVAAALAEAVSTLDLIREQVRNLRDDVSRANSRNSQVKR